MSQFRRYCLVSIGLLISSGWVQAQPPPPAQVMLIGTFHFNDPGQDAVKTKSLDVTAAQSQRYLEVLTNRIASEFRPTRILLEYAEADDELLNGRYRQYVDGDFELRVNEIYQLGFRIAADSGLERIEPFDHREIEWRAEAMLDYARANDPAALETYEARIAQITASMQADQDTLTLRQLLKKHNSPADFAANKALYIQTNDIGAGDGYSGADAAASWWHRNFRMYANVQKAAQPGERVLVIAGAGHVAILADLLALDPKRAAVDVRPLL